MGGVTLARRIGVLESTSDLIMFVDGDDWLELDAIELLVKRQKETNADITIGSYQIVKDNGEVTINPRFERRHLILDQDTYIKQLGVFAISHILWIRLYKRTLFKDDFMLFDRRIELGEDLLANMQMLKYVTIVALEPRAIYNYYVRRNSVSNITNVIIEYYIPLYQTGYDSMGEELSSKYKKYFDTELVNISCNAIYNFLIKNKESYVGTKAYKYIRALIRNNKKIIRANHFSIKKKLQLKLMIHPFLLHFVCRLYLFSTEGKWCNFTSIGDRYEENTFDKISIN